MTFIAFRVPGEATGPFDTEREAKDWASAANEFLLKMGWVDPGPYLFVVAKLVPVDPA